MHGVCRGRIYQKKIAVARNSLKGAKAIKCVMTSTCHILIIIQDETFNSFSLPHACRGGGKALMFHKNQNTKYAENTGERFGALAHVNPSVKTPGGSG